MGFAGRTGEIAAKDLAAGVYPDGDVRQLPHVRRWLADMRALRDEWARLPPERKESFEQRNERLHWEEWAETLQKRLRRRSVDGAYILSPETRDLLFAASEAVTADIDRWFS